MFSTSDLTKQLLTAGLAMRMAPTGASSALLLELSGEVADSPTRADVLQQVALGCADMTVYAAEATGRDPVELLRELLLAFGGDEGES